jgi:hypothetical protein
MVRQKEILFWCVSYKHLRKLVFYYAVVLLSCCYGSFLVGSNLPWIQTQYEFASEEVAVLLHPMLRQLAAENPTNPIFAAFKPQKTVNIKHRKSGET